MKLVGQSAFVFLVCAGVAQLFYYLPAMPDPMASHFDFDGTADRFASRATFFIGAGVVYAIVTVVFLLAPLIASRLANAPLEVAESQAASGKGFWGIFRKIVVSRMVWAGNVTLIFISLVLHFVLAANLRPAHGVDRVLMRLVVAVYFVFLVVWVVSFIRRFFRGVQE